MLHENLKLLRKEKGLSQEELAEQLHVVRQTVSKWEQGLSVPDAAMLIRLAEALDSSVSELLGETIVPQPKTELQEIAEKLEQLNERFARQQERRRKTWRCLFVCLALLAAGLLVSELLITFLRLDAVSALQKDIGIIGGADGPTAIIVSSARFQPGPLIACLAVLILSVVGFIRTGRK